MEKRSTPGKRADSGLQISNPGFLCDIERRQESGEFWELNSHADGAANRADGKGEIPYLRYERRRPQ
jgi:hypothetical protein